MMRFASMKHSLLHLYEITQYPQPNRLTLLRMRLNTKNMPASDHRRERDTVVGGRQHITRIGGFHIIRMHKVGITAVRNAVEHRAGLLQIKAVPPHVRHFERAGWEARHPTGQ